MLVVCVTILATSGVVKKLAEYYSSFLSKENIYSEMEIPAEHAMVRGRGCVGGACSPVLLSQVTDEYGSSCKTLQSPYINNCNYSTTFHLLQHIYGDISYANSRAAKEENVR